MIGPLVIDFVSARSARRLTSWATVELLLPGYGSDVEVDALAVLASSSAAEVGGQADRQLDVTTAPRLRSPMVHVTVPAAAAHEPRLGTADTNVVPGGSRRRPRRPPPPTVRRC